MADGRPEPARGARPGGWRLVAVLALLAVLLQLYGLYRPAGPSTAPPFPHADKLQHLLGFALPTALVLVAVGRRARERGGRLGARATGVVAGAFAAHAVLSEVIQHVGYTSRTGDPLDLAADWAGTALGVLAGRALLRPARVSSR